MRRSLFMDSLRASARSPLVPPGRLRFNIAAQIGGRGLTVILSLAQVAVALPYLGVERYGAWMLMLGVAGALHIADFGIGLASQRAMAEAIARGDGALARGLARQGALWLSGIALGSLVIGAPLIALADWPAWAGLGDVAEARPAALALLVLTAVALPLNTVPRVAGAAQLQWLQALWGAAGSATTLIWVAAAATLSLSLVAIVALLGWPATGWPSLAPEERKRLRRACGHYAIPQFGVALVQGAPATALSLAGGPAAVTAFSLVSRLLAPLAQVQGLALAAVWPAYTEALVRGDLGWVRTRFRRSIGYSLALVVAMAAVTAACNPLIELWTRRTFTGVPATLAWASFAWAGALVLIQPHTTLLIGLGHSSGLARSSLVGYSLAAAALLCAGLVSTPAMVLASGAVALLAVLLPLLLREVRRTTPALN
jgi:O-antigen/teichoic acid export membrane protein